MRYLTRGACRALLTRASIAFALICFSTAFLRAQATPPATQSNDLDAFMAQVLARRDVNRQTLQQYILDDVETFEVLGPGRAPLLRAGASSRGTCATACTCAAPSGSTASRSARRTGGSTRTTGSSRSASGSSGERSATPTSRAARRSRRRARGPAGRAARRRWRRRASSPKPTSWTSSSRPGNYYLAGREQLEGHDVLRIEYYPTRMFNDDDHDGRRRQTDRRNGREAAEGAERRASASRRKTSTGR